MSKRSFILGTLAFTLVLHIAVTIGCAVTMFGVDSFERYNGEEMFRPLFEHKLIDINNANAFLEAKNSRLRLTGDVDVLGAPQDDYSHFYRVVNATELGSSSVFQVIVVATVIPVMISFIALVLCVLLWVFSEDRKHRSKVAS